MSNILSREKQLMILGLLVEGNTLRGITRFTKHITGTGVHRTTVMNLRRDFGNACNRFTDSMLRALTLHHIQCDEIATFVRKQQRNLTPEEKEKPDAGDMYLWVAIDRHTKLIPSMIVGKRTHATAERFMVHLARRLAFPKHRMSDSGDYLPITTIHTDAYDGYPYAVNFAFANYVKHRVTKKPKGNTEQQSSHSPDDLDEYDRRR